MKRGPDAWDRALASTEPMSAQARRRTQSLAARLPHPCRRCRRIIEGRRALHCSHACSQVARARQQRGAPVADPEARRAVCGRCRQRFPLQTMRRVPMGRRAYHCDPCWRLALAGERRPWGSSRLVSTVMVTILRPEPSSQVCDYCGQPYRPHPRATRRRYCSDKCGVYGWRAARRAERKASAA